MNTAVLEKLRKKFFNICNTQTMLLLAANMLSLPAGLFISILSARYLGVNGYGDYSFVNNIWVLASVLFNFGFFQAGSRALIVTDDLQKRREYYGSTIIFLLLLFAVMTLSMACYALFDKNLASKGLTDFFMLTLPSGIVFLCIKLFETMLQADGRITELSLFLFVPKLLIMLALFGMVFTNYVSSANYKLHIFWWMHTMIPMGVFIAILLHIRPAFSRISLRIKELWQFNRTFGLHLYFGSVFALSASALSPVLVGYFCDSTSGVALYSLAAMFASPLSIIPNTIATSYYRYFSTQPFIPRRLTLLTIIISLLAMLFLWMVLPFAVNIFYGQDFYQIVALNKPISAGMILYGLSDYFNRFLSAHGFGKNLRNTAISTAVILFVLNGILIPLYQENGAAYSMLCAGASYFIVVIFFYCRAVKSLRTKDPDNV